MDNGGENLSDRFSSACQFPKLMQWLRGPQDSKHGFAGPLPTGEPGLGNGLGTRTVPRTTDRAQGTSG